MSTPRNTLPVPEVAAAFPGLNLQQFRLLGFCAFYGSYPPSPWTVTMYEGKFGLPKNRTAKERQDLEQAGYLHGNAVRPADYFRIVIPLILHYPEWMPVFEEIGRYRSDEKIYLWKVAKCLADGNMTGAMRLPYPEKNQEAWKYFQPLVLKGDENVNVLSILPQRHAALTLENILQEALAGETLTDGLCNQVQDLARAWLSQPEPILDRAAVCRFYGTGVLPERVKERDSMWTCGIRAISTLIRGDQSEAMEEFQKAAIGLPDSCDGAFPDPVLAWFHALCLIRNSCRYPGKRSSYLISTLLKSSVMRFSTTHTPARILLTDFDSTDKNCQKSVEKELSYFLANDRTPLGRHFAMMLARYFRLEDKACKELGLEGEELSEIAILRNEMAALLPVTTTERERLRDLFGGGSVIGTVPRKEPWALALSSLTEYVSSSQGDSAPKEQRIEKRIIYFVDDKWITAIVEQSRKAGTEEWSKGTLLARPVFLRGGYDSMDMTDLKLCQALGNKTIDIPDINFIVPIMAGTGRVFKGEHTRQPHIPLEIEEEEPFLNFTGKGGNIVVSSNVRRMQNRTIPPVSVFFNNGKYFVIRANPVQRDIIAKLLDVGSFPATALGEIRNAIASLEGILEVRSSLAGTAVIPTMRGSARLCLRISPLPDDLQGYRMEMSAAPYEEGSLRCVPGQGAEDVYDDTGGEARFIRRDLQAEFDNFAELKEYLEAEVTPEFDGQDACSLYANESLLKVLTWAYDHRDKCFVEWPEGRALRFRGDIRSTDVDITVKSNIRWFEVEGQVNVGKDQYDLMELLMAMRASEVKGFVKLGDKDYVRMAKTLQRHLEALEDMLSLRAGRGKVVPVYRVGHLARVLGEEGGLRGTMDEGFKRLLNRMQEAYDSVPEPPTGLRATLRDYQKEGYVWMKRLDAWGAGACLADDMGLGKTVQSLAFLLSKAADGPSLVVAPKSVVPNWDLECARFAPGLRVTVLNDVSNREDCIAAAGPGDLILTTYGVLGTASRLLAAKQWNVVCLDEAHQIKNRNTRVSAAAMDLHAGSRLILTGTPLQNHLGELWNLFQFINPGLLGEWTDFKYKYMHGDLDEEHRDMLRDLVQPFILRRTKEEVLDELPEKIVYEQMVELSPEEMQIYEATRKYVEDRLSKKAGGNREKDDQEHVKIEFFAELTKLRLCACSASLVYDDWQLGSSKTEALLGLLDQISAVEGNSVLVFSQFTSYLAQVKAALDRKGLRYLYLDGQTELDERRTLVEQFQNGDCPLFIASLKAGGLGLNLTAANYVVILDPWWNPAIENQAMDRAHRIGQRRTVTVIRLIAMHTIEEKILRLHETKQKLSDDMLDGTAYSGNLTMDDVLEMVSPFR